jgi:hypothetical protein
MVQARITRSANNELRARIAKSQFLGFAGVEFLAQGLAHREIVFAIEETTVVDTNFLALNRGKPRGDLHRGEKITFFKKRLNLR